MSIFFSEKDEKTEEREKILELAGERLYKTDARHIPSPPADSIVMLLPGQLNKGEEKDANPYGGYFISLRFY